MAKRFNPPPSWPIPYPGWQPEADWEPDPSWPPAPEGWQLWLEDDAEATLPPSFTPRLNMSSYPHAGSSAAPVPVPGRQEHNLAPQATPGRPPWQGFALVAVALAALIGVVWVVTTFLTGDAEDPIPTGSPTAAPTTSATAAPTPDPEPSTTQPTTAEPTTVEPTTAEPTSAEPTTAEPAPTDTGTPGESFAGGVAGDGSIAGLDDDYYFFDLGTPAPLKYLGLEVGTIAVTSLEYDWEPSSAQVLCGAAQNGQYIKIGVQISLDNRWAQVPLDPEPSAAFSHMFANYYGVSGELGSEDAAGSAQFACLTQADQTMADLSIGSSSTAYLLVDASSAVQALVYGEPVVGVASSPPYPAWDLRQ